MKSGNSADDDYVQRKLETVYGRLDRVSAALSGTRKRRCCVRVGLGYTPGRRETWRSVKVGAPSSHL